MENFIFTNPTKILFGRGYYEKVGSYVEKYSKKIMLHYEGNGEIIKKLGIYEKIVESLRKYGIEFIELGGVVPNPKLSLVYEGIKICKENNIGFILAEGGGSVIDSAKAISLGTVYEGDVWDFFNGKAEPNKTLGVGVVLTIPGAGSEMSESSIISNEELKLKSVCDNEYNFPKFSILNPEVCYTIPKHLMACGVADIMSHLMERYFSKSKGTQLSDALLESTMRIVLKYGKKILENPNDYNNCEQIMWAATIAHNGMISSGRIADWSSHRIEHEISALYNITHGAGMAIIFPAWLKYVKEENIEILSKFARNVFLLKEEDDEKISNNGIENLEKFFIDLGLKVKLEDFGVDDKNFELMAEKALCGNQFLGRFKQLSKLDIVNILKLAR